MQLRHSAEMAGDRPVRSRQYLDQSASHIQRIINGVVPLGNEDMATQFTTKQDAFFRHPLPDQRMARLPDYGDPAMLSDVIDCVHRRLSVNYDLSAWMAGEEVPRQ